MGLDRLSGMAKLPGARLDILHKGEVKPKKQEASHPAPAPTPIPEPAAATETRQPATLVLGDAVVADLRESANQIAAQLAAALAEQTGANERLTEMISDAIKTGVGVMQAKRQRPTGWVFTVKRDVRGLIETIEAKASN